MDKLLKKQVKLIVVLIFFPWSISAQVILDNNIGDIVSGPKFLFGPANNWGRTFELQDFGVSQNEELTINSAEIAFALRILNSDPIFIRFNIYEIDNNFPASFPGANLLGSSQTVELKDPAVVYGIGLLQNLTVDFDVPVVVPMNTKRILLEVEETVIRPNAIIVAYTEGETDSSWFLPLPINDPFTYNYITTDDWGVPEAHYYLKAFGELSTVVDHEIVDSINCQDLSVDFKLTNTDKIVTVEWDFGDPGSGTNNSSIDFAPLHEFVSEGIYTVKATVTTIGGEQFDLVKSVEVFALVKAYPVTTIFSCEDVQGTGISSTFDTSNIELTVLGGQIGMEIFYFDSNGDPLPNPLSNPFRNTESGSQTITVRVSNPNSNCFAETQLHFDVLSKPEVNKPSDLYACDNGGGHATFDTPSIEFELIGNQTGLNIEYFNTNGNKLPSPLPSSYQNTIPYQETIFVRVTNGQGFECFSETSFDLIVIMPLKTDLEEKYYLCGPEANLTLSVDTIWDFWEWSDGMGTILSNSHTVTLSMGGNYSLLVRKTENGIQCEKIFSFTVEQPKAPKIEEIRISDFSSSNTVEVLTSGDKDIEYSIDGLYYQKSNIFLDVLGGSYTIHVRSINGCGTTTKDIFILDYPRFFTPNNDGINDYWHIKGIEGFSNATVQIFDRYGKLLRQLIPSDIGWDGTLNGRKVPSSDYWFALQFQNGRTIKNHFTLKR